MHIRDLGSIPSRDIIAVSMYDFIITPVIIVLQRVWGWPYFTIIMTLCSGHLELLVGRCLALGELLTQVSTL